MIYLIISICILSLLFVIFKLFEVFKVNTLQAIIVNYLVAGTLGVYVSDVSLKFQEIPEQPWFLGALFLGILFITVFNVMAITSQKNGLSVAAVAGKMSVVIPIVFGIIVYNESVGIVKIFGILLALVAVYLTSSKSDNQPLKTKNLIYPLLLFLGSGCIDTSLKYVETTYVPEGGVPIFSATIFFIAFFLGLAFLIFQIIKGNFKFHIRNLIGGVLLGIPNYYSIHFLLKALSTEGLESSTLFTLNNVGVVVLSTLFGLILFKEKLIKKNWIGIAIAVISIVLVALF
ncbi:EamA family transporter [Pseudotenacibaculum sp. MALMAid0570]|uniref:EamA family transporter n=1 Tax=Pseudotenacibaculum sp. MALMAid0570 TaxID=3143938 RepID=UPI0032DF1255